MRLGSSLLVLLLVSASPSLADQRADLIARAQIWTAGDISARNLSIGPAATDGFAFNQSVVCEYLRVDLDGRSPKFKCLLDSSDEVKVKYGGDNGEVYAEVAASRLLWALGFGADRMYAVRVRCRGCPEHIGVATQREGERLVEPATIERRFTAHDLDDDLSGWSWVDLERIDERAGGAPRAHRDALKLLAVMLQHTDSKPEQQRLTCLDAECARPFMLLNDVGLMFGRATFANQNPTSSANLAAWAAMRVWKHEQGCIGNLPKSFTGTLRDPIISEEGRSFLSGLLGQLSDAQLRDLFMAAQVERRALDESRASSPAPDAWVRVFREKQADIAARRCPGDWLTQAPPLLGTGAVRWLQSWASMPLTVLMNAVTLLGYLRVYLFVALILAVAVRRHTGAALLLLLALTAVLTDAAKSAASLPRPDGVDSQVRALSLTSNLHLLPDRAARFASMFDRDPHHVASSDDEDANGFPSGHVAAATAFFGGLALLARWRPAWLLLATWVPLMALSRIYLGRHFPIDVAGGAAIGVVATAIAWRLRLHLLDHPVRGTNIALRMCGLASLVSIIALTLRMPTAADAGRLLGLSLGVLIVIRSSEPLESWSTTAKVGSAACAITVFGFGWWVVPQLVDAAELSRIQGIGALLAGALPLPLALLAPFAIARLAAPPDLRAARSA